MKVRLSLRKIWCVISSPLCSMGFNDLDLFGNARVMLLHFAEGLGADDDVVGLFLKEDEKIPIAQHEPLQESWHETRSPLGAPVWRRESSGRQSEPGKNGSSRLFLPQWSNKREVRKPFKVVRSGAMAREAVAVSR
jgi:hypothetical protein